MPTRPIAALSGCADVVAVVVFAAIGRASHGESGDFFGLVGTAAPFLVGLGAAWATPVVRGHPAGLRAGVVVLAGAGLLGLLLRAAFTGRLPLSFAVVTLVALATLLLGWRALSMLIANRAATRVR